MSERAPSSSASDSLGTSEATYFTLTSHESNDAVHVSSIDGKNTGAVFSRKSEVAQDATNKLQGDYVHRDELLRQLAERGHSPELLQKLIAGLGNTALRAEVQRHDKAKNDTQGFAVAITNHEGDPVAGGGKFLGKNEVPIREGEYWNGITIPPAIVEQTPVVPVAAPEVTLSSPDISNPDAKPFSDSTVETPEPEASVAQLEVNPSDSEKKEKRKRVGLIVGRIAATAAGIALALGMGVGPAHAPEREASVVSVGVESEDLLPTVALEPQSIAPETIPASVPEQQSPEPWVVNPGDGGYSLLTRYGVENPEQVWDAVEAKLEEMSPDDFYEEQADPHYRISEAGEVAPELQQIILETAQEVNQQSTS